MNTFMYLFGCLMAMFGEGGALNTKSFITGIVESIIVIGSFIVLRQFYPAVKSLLFVLVGIGVLWVVLLISEPLYIRSRSCRMASDFNFVGEYGYSLKAIKNYEAIFEKSRSDGFAKGHEDGYAAGLDKCRDMLSEIKRLSEQMVSDKAELFDSYEVEIFDTVMEIVNRITLNSLGQKDKAVVKKTIKEAGKSFRGSEYVKLTLSKTDVSEEMAADTDYFKKLFTNVKNVEVEVLKDAPSGTVIIDNGSEITDAGIQTQLKMIEELGRGKYRRAPSRKKAEKQEEPAAQAEPDNNGGEEQSE